MSAKIAAAMHTGNAMTRNLREYRRQTSLNIHQANTNKPHTPNAANAATPKSANQPSASRRTFTNLSML